MSRILVIANKTLLAGRLIELICDRAAEGATIHIVVPASPPYSDLVWTEGQNRAHAETRLEAALALLLETHGVTASGDVGDANPLNAITDAMAVDSYDEVLLSTLPPGPSRWLRQDLPHRVTRRYPDLRLTHVVSEAVGV